jgi:hypothetical protein
MGGFSYPISALGLTKPIFRDNLPKLALRMAYIR